MRVHVTDPHLAADLQHALSRNDCLTAFVEPDELVVAMPTSDPREARTELLFFLRAWKRNHPDATVELIA